MENETVRSLALRAKEACFAVASASIESRNAILLTLADCLKARQTEILAANALDVEAATQSDLSGALLKRLILTEAKIDQMAAGVREVAQLPDPLGRVQLKRELDEGLVLTRLSVPIGLIGVIFESRPDAFIQIASLCLKSGNGAVLKGGKEARHSNRALYQAVHEALTAHSSEWADCMVLAQSRSDIDELLSLDGVIDLMIPRGSNALVQSIKARTKIPVLGHANGICHLYIDEAVNEAEALSVAVDAKCQYPAVCNALETLLVHQKAARTFLPRLVEALPQVEFRLDAGAREALSAVTGGVLPDRVKSADEADWGTEYNDLILAVKTVASEQEAIDHINRWGSHHTDAICSTDEAHIRHFTQAVDSASVMANCSTRFADGFRYGFGAEVGIATGKIHARGPVGLEGLTIYKYVLVGHGHSVAPYAAGEKAFTHRDLG